MSDAIKTVIPNAVKTVTLTINGQATTVAKGTTVLEAAAAMGIHIPTFCWHPKLKPVGACRMCYVEIEKMPKLQVSCATEAMDGMVVQTESEQVKRGRKAVIEFILINHPLDCPTCDKGGECELQNLTFAHGYDDSRFDFQKKRKLGGGVTTTFDDKRIGPEIVLNRNRCILCYKCVRSNKEAFGEYDLGAFERGNATEIDAAPGEQVANPFSGNLVEICPVGALTNTDWRYKMRVWLTKTAPSVCNFTSSGTNISFYKEENRRLLRVTSRRNDDIDDGWLSDVTRYGYQIAHSPDRIRTPMIKKDGRQTPATWEDAIALIAKRLKEVKSSKGAVCIGALAAANLDNESLHSLSKLMRVTIGSNNIDFRTEYKALPSTVDSPYSILASQPFSIADVDRSDLIVSFGSDLVKEHANEYLRMRKAYNFTHPKILAINSYSVKSSDIADVEIIHKPGTEELLIAGVCLAAIEENIIGSALVAEIKAKIVPTTLAEASRACGVPVPDIKLIARFLVDAKRVSFLIGEQVSLSRDRDSVSSALCNLNFVFGLSAKGQIAALARHPNSVGAQRLGIVPVPSTAIRNFLSSAWGTFPDAPPHTTDQMFSLMKSEELDALLVVGANPIMLYPDREFAQEALEKLDFLVACDLVETETTAMADVVLPLSSWAEYSGTYLNLEGRAQRTSVGIRPQHKSLPGHDLLNLLASKMGNPLFSSESERDAEIEEVLNAHKTPPMPTSLFEVKPPASEQESDFPHILIVGDDPHHRGHLTEKSASLVSFCGDAYVEISPDIAAKLGIEDGDSVRVESQVGKVIARAKISSDIENDVVFMPRNFVAAKVNALQSRKKRLDHVRLSKLSG